MSLFTKCGSTFVLFGELQNVHAENGVNGPRTCRVVVDRMEPADLNATLERRLRLRPAQIWTPDKFIVMGVEEVTDSDGHLDCQTDPRRHHSLPMDDSTLH